MTLPGQILKKKFLSQAHIGSQVILFLCGELFGMCVSDNIPHDVKVALLMGGSIGLIAFLALGLIKHAHDHTQQRVAVIHAEERLERHAHADSRASGSC